MLGRGGGFVRGVCLQILETGDIVHTFVNRL